MTASSPSLPSRERAALADLLDELGPDAPTCCAGWTTAHMAAHLVVRDRRPDAMPGYGWEEAGFGGPLASWSHRVEDRLRTGTPFPELVARLVAPRARAGHPGPALDAGHAVRPTEPWRGGAPAHRRRGRRAADRGRQ